MFAGRHVRDQRVGVADRIFSGIEVHLATDRGSREGGVDLEVAHRVDVRVRLFGVGLVGVRAAVGVASVAAGRDGKSEEGHEAPKKVGVHGVSCRNWLVPAPGTVPSWYAKASRKSGFCQ